MDFALWTISKSCLVAEAMAKEEAVTAKKKRAVTKGDIFVFGFFIFVGGEHEKE